MRLPFDFDTESRDGSSNKDERLTNALVEQDDASKYAVIRPGLNLNVSTEGIGKGLVAFQNELISVYGDTVYAGLPTLGWTYGTFSGLFPTDDLVGFLAGNPYGIPTPEVYETLVTFDGTTYMALDGVVVYKSTDSGVTWTYPGELPPIGPVDELFGAPNSIATDGGGNVIVTDFRSDSSPTTCWTSDYGSNWVYDQTNPIGLTSASRFWATYLSTIGFVLAVQVAGATVSIYRAINPASGYVLLGSFEPTGSLVDCKSGMGSLFCLFSFGEVWSSVDGVTWSQEATLTGDLALNDPPSPGAFALYGNATSIRVFDTYNNAAVSQTSLPAVDTVAGEYFDFAEST